MEDVKVTISLKTYTNLVTDHNFVELIRKRMAAERIENRSQKPFETLFVYEQEMPDAWSL